MKYTVVLLTDNSDNGTYYVERVEADTPDDAYNAACKQASPFKYPGHNPIDDYCGGPVFAGWLTELPTEHSD